MDKSLDEIIKSRKPTGRKVKRGFINKANIANKAKVGNKTKRFGTSPPVKVVDARNKIIQKNRAKIFDARDKLVEKSKSGGDARLKLLSRKQFSSPSKGLRKARLPAAVSTKPKMKYQPMRRAPLPDVIEIPHGYVDYDNMSRMEEDEYDTSNLRRTVKNDIMPQYNVPYIPSERRGIEPNWTIDPFNVYELPVRGPDPIETISVRREIRNMSPDILQPKSILRSNRTENSYDRRYQEPPTHLSYEMRTRLQHAPDPHASVGIFSNPLKPQPSGSGYRIVVSNLHNSVSQSDIKELFEDIGELYEARLVRPGVSEVIYKNLKDAEKAVDTYHNRQLDGQPMKCLLVNPRSSNIPSAPGLQGYKSSYNGSSNNNRSTSNKTPLEIDIDALHKVLFRRQ